MLALKPTDFIEILGLMELVLGSLECKVHVKQSWSPMWVRTKEMVLKI